MNDALPSGSGNPRVSRPQSEHPASDFSYPPAARLHRPVEFKAALRGRRLARGALLEVLVPRAPAASMASMARLGLVIPKRQAALAATRNTIKRVIREAFRLRRHALPAHDLVVRLHSRTPSLSLTQLRQIVRQDIDRLLSDAERRLSRSSPEPRSAGREPA